MLCFILLLNRELLAVQEHLLRSRGTTSTGNSDHVSPTDNSSALLRCKQLVQTVERVILKIDEALLEARLARDAMLLYIQVRLCLFFSNEQHFPSIFVLPGVCYP